MRDATRMVMSILCIAFGALTSGCEFTSTGPNGTERVIFPSSVNGLDVEVFNHSSHPVYLMPGPETGYYCDFIGAVILPDQKCTVRYRPYGALGSVKLEAQFYNLELKQPYGHFMRQNFYLPYYDRQTAEWEITDYMFRESVPAPPFVPSHFYP